VILFLHQSNDGEISLMMNLREVENAVDWCYPYFLPTFGILTNRFISKQAL